MCSAETRIRPSITQAIMFPSLRRHLFVARMRGMQRHSSCWSSVKTLLPLKAASRRLVFLCPWNYSNSYCWWNCLWWSFRIATGPSDIDFPSSYEPSSATCTGWLGTSRANLLLAISWGWRMSSVRARFESDSSSSSKVVYELDHLRGRRLWPWPGSRRSKAWFCTASIEPGSPCWHLRGRNVMHLALWVTNFVISLLWWGCELYRAYRASTQPVWRHLRNTTRNDRISNLVVACYQWGCMLWLPLQRRTAWLCS